MPVEAGHDRVNQPRNDADHTHVDTNAAGDHRGDQPPTTPPEYVPSTYQAEIGVFKAAPGLMRACGVYGSRPRWFGAG